MHMHEEDKAILKSLVSVAWADGRVTSEETDIIEALLQAFDATPEDTAEMRSYAKTRRTLADIPLTELSADDRRLLVQHAVLLTFIDGAQSSEEKTLLAQLCEKLRIPANEATSLLSAAESRAKRFLDLL
jgi:tellurite resistance protein